MGFSDLLNFYNKHVYKDLFFALIFQQLMCFMLLLNSFLLCEWWQFPLPAHLLGNP